MYVCFSGFLCGFCGSKGYCHPLPRVQGKGWLRRTWVREFDFILRLATQQAIGADVIERRVEATAAHRNQANLGI